VDDHLMKISHVMRAEEWISSTPKHVLLYQAFAWEAPEFIHMPLLRNKDKSKISKRKNPVSLNYYKEAGFLPSAMLNYLGMMGWTMPDGEEKFTVEKMVKEFDFGRISLGGPVFDMQKLTWLNGLYLRERPSAEIVKDLRALLLSDDMLLEVAELMHERIDKLEDFIDKASFFFGGDCVYDASATKMLLPKKRTPKEMAEALLKAAEVIDTLPDLELDSLKEAMNALREELELKGKEFFMPLRIAVTGRKDSPPLFESMVVLGKEKCRRRLRNAANHLKAYKPPAES
ncbi:MAG: glutamate--tRNA ligase, partial [Deltaproteobacteria bacterium]|nr:glutamate--tRNA ligase [Deltaproteobacteria bacterium]